MTENTKTNIREKKKSHTSIRDTLTNVNLLKINKTNWK